MVAQHIPSARVKPEDIAPWAHDLRNAVQAMHYASGHLDERLGGRGGQVGEAIADIRYATLEMRALLDGLLATCEGEVDHIAWAPVTTGPLVARAERRMRAELGG